MRQLARGSDNGNAKLTPEQALDVHLLARSKRYWRRELAEAFGISQSEVSLIEHRRRWRWLLSNEGNEMTDDKTKDAEFEARLAASEKRVAELEAKLRGERPAPFKPEPYQPRDYTAGASMDADTKRELAKSFPADLVRDLRADAFKPNPVTGTSQAQLTKGGNDRVQIQRGTGWQDERKIEPPPGVALADRLMDMQDAIDKADLQRRLGTTAKTKE
jgi:hypothetical protein